MKNLVLMVVFLMLGSVSGMAAQDLEKSVPNALTDKESSEVETPVAAKPNLPRMPASDGTCAVGEVYNATDSTCVSAGK